MASSRALLWSALVIAGSVGLARLVRSGPRITADSRILLLGDSMAQALAIPLGQLAKDSNHPFESLSSTGTTIASWAHRRGLAAELAHFKPTLVIVALGTNDAYLPGAPAASVAQDVQLLLSILAQSGATVAWVGPPQLDRPDNGVRAALEHAVPPAHYFRSDTMLLQRSDGLHPTARAATGWAGAIWRWLSA